MDSVWFVRSGPNEELRFSLRSAYYHVGVETIWIIGDAPDWYCGPLVKGNRYRTKQKNVYDNVRIIAEHPALPDEVAVWNDDMYAMEPGMRIELNWRGPLRDQIASLKVNGWWKQSLQITMEYLNDLGYDEPVSYELHRPFPIVRATMAEALRDAARVCPENPPQWRTIYGNVAQAPGEKAKDGKLHHTNRPVPRSNWLSTNDRSYHSAFRRLARLFPKPSPWEK